MAKNTDTLLEHEYDGIQEYDNPTPGWWNMTLIATIIFSMGYFTYYHILGGQSVAEAYAEDMKVHAALKAEQKAAVGEITEDQLSAVMADASQVAAGSKIFQTNCVACHLSKGEGSIGPNLTDAYWKNGDGSLVAIRKVVDEGVLEKGMAAWGKVLKPEELNQVVAFVGTIRNTNVPGKAPEGNKIGGLDRLRIP